jgi:hypothetical protein
MFLTDYSACADTSKWSTDAGKLVAVHKSHTNQFVVYSDPGTKINLEKSGKCASRKIDDF